MTKGGYFKKITTQSWRGNDEQKLKDGDEVLVVEDAQNTDEVIFFSDKSQVYKAKMDDFDTSKASSLGDYIPSKLGFDDGEGVLFMHTLREYPQDTNVVFVFENGKCVKVPLSAYETKTNRKRLTGAYSDASPAVASFVEKSDEPFELIMCSDAKRALVVSTKDIPVKSTRSSQGVQIFTLKPGQKVISAKTDPASVSENPSRYRKTKLPSTGVALSDADSGTAQLKLI